jgi:hypothetical protein
MHMFIGVSAHTCMSICVCSVFLKKKMEAGSVGMTSPNWRLAPLQR